MKEEKTIKRLSYNILKSPEKTILPADSVRHMKFTLEEYESLFMDIRQ